MQHKGLKNLFIKQVRLFLSEECPSQVGSDAQDHLQAKTSLLVHPGGAGSDDILPPGFEGTQSLNQTQIKPSQIPVIKWTNPVKVRVCQCVCVPVSVLSNFIIYWMAFQI